MRASLRRRMAPLTAYEDAHHEIHPKESSWLDFLQASVMPRLGEVVDIDVFL